MTKTKKKIIKITAIAVACVLAVCIVIAMVIVLPQLRKKGTRYENTHSFGRGDVQMIAHRGLSGIELENTKEAFEAAGKKSYYGIEADVQVTEDGKYIIVHDGDLNRLAGLDIQIAESTFDELRALKFKDVYGDSDEENRYLPSLEEYIDICKKYDKQAVLELKFEMEAQHVAAIAKTVEDMGWFERSTFISFERTNLLALREAYPEADAQYIVQECTDDDIDFMVENKFDADLCWISVTPSRVRKLHKAGLKVNCWTVDGRACAWYMMACGVDFITTNILE